MRREEFSGSLVAIEVTGGPLFLARCFLKRVFSPTDHSWGGEPFGAENFFGGQAAF